MKELWEAITYRGFQTLALKYVGFGFKEVMRSAFPWLQVLWPSPIHVCNNTIWMTFFGLNNSLSSWFLKCILGCHTTKVHPWDHSRRHHQRTSWCASPGHECGWIIRRWLRVPPGNKLSPGLTNPPLSQCTFSWCHLITCYSQDDCWQVQDRIWTLMTSCRLLTSCRLWADSGIMLPVLYWCCKTVWNLTKKLDRLGYDIALLYYFCVFFSGLGENAFWLNKKISKVKSGWVGMWWSWGKKQKSTDSTFVLLQGWNHKQNILVW